MIRVRHPDELMTEKVIWAKWQVQGDGRVDVVVTCGTDDGYVQRPASYETLDEAAEALGESFRAVVSSALQAGSYAGRWRP